VKLAEALGVLMERLEAASVEYAVIGGLAASARGEVRFTRDVDVAVAVGDDAEAEQLVFQLREAGYQVLATVEQEATERLATVRLQGPNGVVCDLIFATSGIEAEVVRDATAIEVLPGLVVQTASVECLLAMKTLSATPSRPRDMGDIQAMLRAHPDFDEVAVQELLTAISRRGFDRGQDLPGKWSEIRAALKC